MLSHKQTAQDYNQAIPRGLTPVQLSFSSPRQSTLTPFFWQTGIMDSEQSTRIVLRSHALCSPVMPWGLWVPKHVAPHPPGFSPLTVQHPLSAVMRTPQALIGSDFKNFLPILISWGCVRLNEHHLVYASEYAEDELPYFVWLN